MLSSGRPWAHVGANSAGGGAQCPGFREGRWGQGGSCEDCRGAWRVRGLKVRGCRGAVLLGRPEHGAGAWVGLPPPSHQGLRALPAQVNHL